jgi:hypothetical protein
MTPQQKAPNKRPNVAKPSEACLSIFESKTFFLLGYLKAFQLQL